MRDWKTTVSGLVAAVATAARAFGVEIPEPVTTGITSLALFALAFFAKDK